MGKKVHLLDYVAGNIRSLVNAIEKCGYEVEWIRSPDDVKNAEVRGILFSCMGQLTSLFFLGVSILHISNYIFCSRHLGFRLRAQDSWPRQILSSLASGGGKENSPSLRVVRMWSHCFPSPWTYLAPNVWFS